MVCVDEVFLTWTDLAALVGAAAWVPQLGSWIRGALSRPKLALFPSPSPEIGFMAYGTALNLPCVISASVDDAVIVAFEAELTHESGQRFTLPWRGLSESLAEIESSSGEVEHHRRQQPALALKVITEEVAEQTVMFQDAQFQRRLLDAYSAVESRRDLIAQHERDLAKQSTELFKSDEFAKLQDVVRGGLCWRAGEYRVQFRAQIAERSEPFEFDYRFRLSAQDIARLEENVAKLLKVLREGFTPGVTVAQAVWNWRYPEMTPIDESKALLPSVQEAGRVDSLTKRG